MGAQEFAMGAGGRWKASGKQWKRGKPLARKLRAQQTPAEARLWERVRKNRINGVPFRRQHEIGQFFTDFYCPQVRLIVEVDGAIHKRRASLDREREEWFRVQGFTVLRFTNDHVDKDIDAVIHVLETKVSELLKRH